MSTYKDGLKHALRQRDGDSCYYCSQAMDFSSKPLVPELRATIEHLKPKSKGGTYHLDNLVLAHPLCNTRQSAMPIPTKTKPDGRNLEHWVTHWPWVKR